MSRDRRSLYFLYAASFFIFLNFNFSQSVTPLYILDIGGTEFYSGLQSALFFLTAVVLRFYFGPLADRKGNRIALLIGGLAFMTSPILFLLNESVPYVLLVRMYQAIGLAAFFSSASSSVSAQAPREKLGAYIGFYRLVSMSTLLMGPSLAFKVVREYGYSKYHALGILVGLMAIALLYFVQDPQKVENAGGREVLTSNNMLGLLKDKKLLPIYQSILFVSIFFGLALTFTVIFVEQYAIDANPGIYFTLFGVGCLTSNLSTGTISDRKGRAAVVFPCMMIAGVGMVAFYFLPVYRWIMYVGSILTGFGFAGSMTVLITWVIDTAPLEKRTTALALQDSAEDIGIALGAFLSGIFISIIGMSWVYGISGGLLVLFAIWQGLASLRKKNVIVAE